MVLSLRGDGVFPPSLQYTRGGKRTRTAMRHTGWPPMADREEPSGPENPTPPPSHRKVRVVKRGGKWGELWGGRTTLLVREERCYNQSMRGRGWDSDCAGGHGQNGHRADRTPRRVRGAGQVGILRHCFVVLRSTHGHHMGQFDGAEAIGALGFDRLSQQESRFGNFDALFWASRQLILRVWGFLRES